MAEEPTDLLQEDAPGASPEPSDQPDAPIDGAEKEDHLSRRIKRWTREREDLRRERDRLAQENFELRQARVPPPAVEPPAVPTGRPDQNAYDSYDEWVEAVADWKAEQKFQQREQQSQQAKLREERTAQAETWHERVLAAQTKYDDWDEVLQGADVLVTPALREALLTSEQGADVLYYLARHEDEARRLSRLLPLEVARAIGRIEASLATPPPAEREPAPPPIPAPVRPVGTSTSGQRKAPADMTPQEYRAWREKGGGR